MNTRTYQVIDTANGGTVVAEFPTHRRALNYTRKLEPDTEYRTNRTTKWETAGSAWRYMIRPVTKVQE
jgi:hypothetical protein